MQYNNTPKQEQTVWQSLQDGLDSVVDSLGPKDDKYVNFLKKNKDAIGSEISLVFSGKFASVAATTAIAAGLGLRYILQAS